MFRYWSVLVLLLFLALLVGRSLMLRRRGVKAAVFMKKDPSGFLLIPILLVFVYAVFAFDFGLPIPKALAQPFWVSRITKRIGLTLCMIALIGFAAALKSFGASFRTDEKNPGRLVTSGMFAVSRNPVSVAFLVFFFGMFVRYPNWLLFLALVLSALAIHRKILRKEAFLKARCGKDYENYCKRVRRYL